ncbi:hypothetical protein ACQPZA_13600 [Pseudonocardia xinjiangensis]|uniref:hypothetical protein n=1 Tax=Pseudonocardia xinjiangensis TaxID=75289 RepID=UPI003D8EDA07
MCSGNRRRGGPRRSTLHPSRHPELLCYCPGTQERFRTWLKDWYDGYVPGFAPRIPFHQAVRDIVEWRREHP